MIFDDFCQLSRSRVLGLPVQHDAERDGGPRRPLFEVITAEVSKYQLFGPPL